MQIALQSVLMSRNHNNTKEENRMKRITALLLSGLMLLLLLAGCGGSKTEEKDNAGNDDVEFVWTRTGSFEDENGNHLIITLSEEKGYEGWAISFMKGDEVFGWIIQQDGKTLHGDLIYDDSGEYIVTISEEGEDGVMLETEDGETYHFKPMEEGKTAAVIVNINTEGLGYIAFAPEGEKLQFDEEYPAQSAQLNLEGPETYQLAAKADEGWKFVKWTKDGADYSTDEQITVAFTEEHVEYIAVFDIVE